MARISIAFQSVKDAVMYLQKLGWKALAIAPRASLPRKITDPKSSGGGPGNFIEQELRRATAISTRADKSVDEGVINKNSPRREPRCGAPVPSYRTFT